MRFSTICFGSIALFGALAAPLGAQVCTTQPCLTFSESAVTPNAGNYGSSVAILSDYDGGGRRDLAIVSSASGLCQIVSGESGGTTPNVLAATGGAGPGSVVVSLGDIDGIPGDEFALSFPGSVLTPNSGRIWFFSVRPAVFGGGFSAQMLYSVTGPGSLGTAMVMVDTLNGPRLAVGVPGQNQVHLYSVTATGATITQTLIPWVTPPVIIGLYDPNLQFGASLAVGPSANTAPGMTPRPTVLAVGAPNYSSAPQTSPAQGFVAVFNLEFQLPGINSNQPTSFLYRGVASEQLGTAIASVGFLPGAFNSPLSDFVVLGRSQGPFTSSVLAAFHTPSGPSFTTTPLYGATIPLISSSIAGDGRLASAGDLDGDGVGDAVLTLGTAARVFSTTGGGLNPIGTMAIYNGSNGKALSVASGPDVFQKGARDVVVGAPFSSNFGGIVEVLPLAGSARLPNPVNPSVPNLLPLNRPLPGAYRMRAVAQTGTAVFLLAGLAPATPVLFQAPATFAYVPADFITMDSGIVPTGGIFDFAPVSLTPGFNYEAFVFQVLQLNASGSMAVSNGLLSRLGQF
ncbi:MAG: hypothetical protein GC161_06225 [Planctomycetaceae bacterium]|nr:hypothetical protein [Planctomycetaceae bacterium]